MTSLLVPLYRYSPATRLRNVSPGCLPSGNPCHSSSPSRSPSREVKLVLRNVLKRSRSSSLALSLAPNHAVAKCWAMLFIRTLSHTCAERGAPRRS
jgi:hypothetical protein